jgi:hypothetical protein
MMPIAVYEALAGDATLNALGITGSRIYEMQSINRDERPDASGYFLIVDFQESTLFSQTYTGLRNGIPKGPRVMDIAVHISWDKTREYNTINKILNAIDAVLLPIEHMTGSDGVRVTCIRPSGRSRNLQDDGWKTTTRHATYGILYDESAA